MTMVFPYALEAVPQAVPTLGGRWVRPRPLLPVGLTGPTGTVARDGLLDCGSDDTVFPAWLAAQIGLDLSGAPMGEMRAVGGAAFQLRYADVTLRITDGQEFRTWPARVGFLSARLRQPLLGFAGFLQFFTAAFHGDLEKVELTINSLYPGV
jgi:hypothetical protein